MKKYYLKEFSYHDGEGYITFIILDLNLDNKTVTLTANEKLQKHAKSPKNGAFLELTCRLVRNKVTE